MSCPHRSSTRSISIDTQHAKGPAAKLRQVLVCVKYLVEFRPAGRNKMEIHVIRQLRRPDRTSVSGFTAYGCRVLLAGRHTAHLASVEFCASGAKLCAQSRRSPFCQESVSFFDSLERPASRRALVLFHMKLHLRRRQALQAIQASHRCCAACAKRSRPIGPVIEDKQRAVFVL